jgi:hypothetical protein
MLRSSTKSWGPAFLALLAPALAQAYIPPSSFIIKTLSGKHAGVKSVVIRGTVTAIESEKPSATRFRVVTVFDPATRLLKSWALDDAGSELYAVERRGDALSPVDTALLDSQPRKVAQLLKSKGVPIRPESAAAAPPPASNGEGSSVASAAQLESTSLARWNGTTAWVIGKRGKPGSEVEPQIWVEKDTFVPLRIIFPDESGNPLDVQFFKTRFQSEFPYPRLITLVTKNHVTALQDETTEFVVNGGAKELETPVTPGFTEAGNAASSVLRDLVRKYYESIR